MTLTIEPSRLRRRPLSPTGSTPRLLWAAVTAVTGDGLRVRIRTEFTRDARPGESSPETSDAIARDAVERALRSYLGSLPTSMLPVPGEKLEEVEKRLVAHEVIDNVVVLTTEVAADSKP